MPTMADWSTTAASNGTSSGVNIAENCPAANMNNWAREIMAQLRGAVTTNALAVSGNGTIGGTLAVTGNATFSGTITVSGSVTFAGLSASSLAVSGNATVGGTLVVTGAATFSGSAYTKGTQYFGPSDHGNIASDSSSIYVRGNTVGFQNSAASATFALLSAAGFELNAQPVSWSSLSNFYLSPNSGNPLLVVDSGDWYQYDRSNNEHQWAIGSSVKFKIGANGVYDANAIELGYKDCPQNAQSGAYTLVLADRGKDLYLTSSGAVTIPPNSSVAFPLGTTIAFTNDGSSRTLTQGAGVTLKLAGSGATGNRTLGAGAMGAIKKVATDTWYVSGAGVS